MATSQQELQAGIGMVVFPSVDDWFREQGTARRFYDATNPVTQDLMRDEGIQAIKMQWIKRGKTNESLFYNFSVPEYIRELIALDGTGSMLGSYRVTIQQLPNKLLFLK